jgi:aminotransferase
VKGMYGTLGAVGSLDAAARAAGFSRAGYPVLRLIGAPIVPMPEHIRRAAMDAIEVSDPPRDTRGLPELRGAIASQLGVEQGLTVDADANLLITHGAMHGLNLVLRALIGRGDEVVIPSPCFFFEGAVQHSGAAPVYVSGSEEFGWSWNLDAIEKAITSRTRALLICNPNNPDGFLPREADLRNMLEIAARHELLVIADESYQRFTFDGLPFTPIASVDKGYPHLVTVTSLSKNYAFANWRVGYVSAQADILASIHRAFEWDAIYCGYVQQCAALAAITGPQDWLEEPIRQYQRKRDVVYAAIQESNLFRAVRPQGGVFVLVNCGELAATAQEIDELLLSNGVPSVPGRYFHAPETHVRLVFGSALPVLHELAHKLASLRPRSRGRH